MAIELTNEEKTGVIEQHLKNLAFSKYNLEVSVQEAEAITIPNQSVIDSLSLQINDIDSQKAALTAELDSLK